MLSRQTLSAFSHGERQAFVEVFRAHGGTVRHVVGTFWAGAFDREEAMQEVWLHIWKNRASLDPERGAEVGGWIATVARRRCIDLLRSQRSPRNVADVSRVDDVDGMPLAADPLPDVIERQQVSAAVAAFVASLKPAWQAFFQLCFVDGASYEEIGRQLGVGKLRCKYMKKVLAGRARAHPALMASLDRLPGLPAGPLAPGGARAS